MSLVFFCEFIQYIGGKGRLSEEGEVQSDSLISPKAEGISGVSPVRNDPKRSEI